MPTQKVTLKYKYNHIAILEKKYEREVEQNFNDMRAAYLNGVADSSVMGNVLRTQHYVLEALPAARTWRRGSSNGDAWYL